MARYSREFLIPYLEDLCALHLAKRRLEERINTLDEEIENTYEQAKESVKQPKMESYLSDSDSAGCGTGCLGVFCFFLSLIILIASCIDENAIGLVFSLVLICIAIVLFIRAMSAKSRLNEEIGERNKQREIKYSQCVSIATMNAQGSIDAINNKISICKEEISKIDGLLAKQYSINIIPGWYRDLYPAVYLYDWFSNSRADDLDVALNTLVLEQIKDRLDMIIYYQSESILNQRVIIANQRKSMEQSQLYHDELMSKLNSLQADAEEQSMYLSMIEANTAANAYFAAADYLRS